MTSKVKICNLALARLGISSITSLTDNTIEAKMCNTMFEEVAKEVMTTGVFSSTITRQDLNLTDNTPAFKFVYEFQLPTNPKCLRVLDLEDYCGEFAVEGDKLLCDVSTMAIRYIAYLTDSDNYDEMLKRCIVAKLAAELAYPLTGSATLADGLYKKYLNEMDESKAIDGQQGSNLLIVSTDLTDDVR